MDEQFRESWASLINFVNFKEETPDPGPDLNVGPVFSGLVFILEGYCNLYRHFNHFLKIKHLD